MTEQTTQKKYELLKDDTIEHLSRTLYRIKALITFGAVVAGELGGYIEAEKNLELPFRGSNNQRILRKGVDYALS